MCTMVVGMRRAEFNLANENACRIIAAKNRTDTTDRVTP